MKSSAILVANYFSPPFLVCMCNFLTWQIFYTQFRLYSYALVLFLSFSTISLIYFRGFFFCPPSYFPWVSRSTKMVRSCFLPGRESRLILPLTLAPSATCVLSCSKFFFKWRSSIWSRLISFAISSSLLSDFPCNSIVLYCTVYCIDDLIRHWKWRMVEMNFSNFISSTFTL